MVQLAYINEYAKAYLSLPQKWQITPTDELLALLTNLLGEDQVVMRY